ncbi:MAG: ABC transporter ATP-binding protein/permease [Anaerolineaceae bacterium]|nr:ABC transporter ATP-binding protein/permease [Anaerolineaceae bacterium]
MTTTIEQSEFSIPLRYKTNRKNPIIWLSSHVIHQWYFLIMGVVGAIGNAILASVPAIYFGEVFNILINPDPDINKIFQIALIITITQIIRGVLQFSRNYGFELLAQRMERNVREELYISLLGKSMTFHALQSVGDLMARATNDVREVNYIFSPGFNMVFGSINFLFIPLIVGPSYHPALILAPALFIVAYFLSLWRYIKILKPATTEVRRSFGEMNSRLSEAIDGIETVKGAAQEGDEIERFNQNAKTYRNAMVKQGDIEAKFLPLLLLAITMGSGLLHALVLYNQNLISLGNVISYFSTLALLGFPTFTSIFSYSQISLGLAGARRILELINHEDNLDQNVSGYNQSMKGKVTFHNVEFKYSAFEPTLKNISFSIKPGQTIAIVGQTGSGKTTLARLINRTYDVTAGEIYIDDVNVKDWYLDKLRSNISIIEQDIFLFSSTIADNIAFGKPGAAQAEIENAAKAAQAHEFIMEIDGGYQSVIGERGVTLSGGQRQRIALARAFLTNPRILILDDSTSAIDSETEDKIQKAIYTAAKGRTTFIITHRLSQIRWADLILVLRKGEIVAKGTHENLMLTSKSYRHIFSE